LGIAAAAFAESSAESPAPARVEARSADLLAIGLAHGEQMTIRLSRLMDNAPVRDAAVTVVLRGVAHPTTAEADGSFTLQAKDLAIPGAAAVEFQVAQTASRETLKGTLQVIGAAGSSEDKNTARQLWWWVLNFAVCIGFLMLISRRRKSAQD
jgi:cobalt-zinc-cadmium efflux system membrane fusion protein